MRRRSAAIEKMWREQTRAEAQPSVFGEPAPSFSQRLAGHTVLALTSASHRVQGGG
jgi:hypothetical protein